MPCSNSRRVAGGRSTRRAGSPDACSSRSRTVTCSRSTPRQSSKIAATDASSVMAPDRTCSMITAVVAIGLVSDARSKIVADVAALEPASKVRAPNAPAQTMSRAVPTSTAAAGKTRAAMARSITACASASDTAHHGANRYANHRTDEHVPGPGQSGEFVDTNHRRERHTDPGHDARLRRGAREDAEQERAEHRTVDDRGDRQADRE